MAQNITIPNYTSLNSVESIELAEAAVAGQTTLTVKNNQGIGINDFIMVGGGERSEIRTVQGVTGANSITVTSALSFSHPRDSKGIKLFGDQIKVYRATNIDGRQPADDSFAAVATISIDPDQLTTEYTDQLGGSNFWYKFTYYNSISTSETTLRDSTAVRDGGNYTSLDSIRAAAGFTNAPYISDDMIEQHRKSAQSYIDGRLSGRFVVPFADPINAHIANITKTLAAGYLLQEQYKSDPERGKSKVDWAVAEITKIVDGVTQLIDVVGVASSTVTAASSGAHWPDNTTEHAPAEAGGGARFFRVSDRY